MPRMRPLLAALCLAVLTTVSGASGAPEPARNVDLARLAGRWYVIARMPAPAEHHGLGASFEYRVRSDGRIDDLYTAHTGSLGGPVETVETELRPDPAMPSRWQIKTGWLGSTERLLLYVSPGYKRAIVGDGERESAWILAREPEIPEWSLAGLLARLSVQGYDVSKIRRVVQRPEQLGKSGFE